MSEMRRPAEPILDVQNLIMHFPLVQGLFSRKYAVVQAVNDISFSVTPRGTFGLVGESGCGKTTTAKCILRILKPTSGKILYHRADIASLSSKGLRPYRRDIQLIFQDPYSSLDPRQSIFSIIKEALTTERVSRTKSEIRDRVEELLLMVGLDPSMDDRFPHEMSGGQRQRLGIARALACSPQLIICDEPVSALDVSIQAQIINLFEELRENLGLTYLFIAHDLAVVRHISETIAVMYLGKIVEITNSKALYANPLHPYTKALLSAVPITDYYVEQKRQRIVLHGDVPSPINIPSGCPFHPRCSFATEKCRTEVPLVRKVGEEHSVACHHA